MVWGKKKILLKATDWFVVLFSYFETNYMDLDGRLCLLNWAPTPRKHKIFYFLFTVLGAGNFFFSFDSKMSVVTLVGLKQTIGICVLGANSTILGNSKLIHEV